MLIIASSYARAHPCAPTVRSIAWREPLGAYGVGRLPYVGFEVFEWP